MRQGRRQKAEGKRKHSENLKSLLLSAFCLLPLACGTASNDLPPPVQTPPDRELVELRTAMTELLERLDVLNDRIARLEQTAGEVAASPPQPQPQQRALVGAQMAEKYRQAIILLGKNQYPEAREAFQGVFDADPSGELADNALFWIGETYYSAGAYGEAISHYRRVATEYSDRNKAPDALYKLALAYEKTGDLALARQTLQDVMSRYPYSAPATSARSALERIKY